MFNVPTSVVIAILAAVVEDLGDPQPLSPEL
jgi:hypothetical protein